MIDVYDHDKHGDKNADKHKPRAYIRYKIDQIQKALRMAERLPDPPQGSGWSRRDVFNWAEILRSAEEIMKNADKDETSQENARRRYLEVLADMEADHVPPPLRPMIMAAQAILECDDEAKAQATANKILEVTHGPTGDKPDP